MYTHLLPSTCTYASAQTAHIFQTVHTTNTVHTAQSAQIVNTAQYAKTVHIPSECPDIWNFTKYFIVLAHLLTLWACLYLKLGTVRTYSIRTVGTYHSTALSCPTLRISLKLPVLCFLLSSLKLLNPAQAKPSKLG